MNLMTRNGKEFKKYILPSILAMVGSSCYVLVDTLFIIHISESALAALNIVLPIYSAMIAFGSFIAVGASTYYSILKARGELKKGSVFFTHAVVFGMAVSIFIAALMMINKYQVAAFMGANEETMKLCIDYMNAYITLSPFIVLQHLVASFIRNDGEPKLASISGLAGSLFNLTFDYFFIFTLDLGMFGAALATGLAPIVGLLVCIPFFVKRKNSFHLVICRPSLKVLRDISKLGLPTLIQGASGGVVMLAFNRQLLSIGGNMAVTAYGIIVNITVIIQFMMTGISEGAQPLISRCYGSKKYKDIKMFAKMSIGSIVLIATIGMAIIVFAGEWIIGIFDPLHNTTLREMTQIGMIIYFIGLYPNGISSFLSIYFTSVETPLPSTLLSVLKTGIIITPLVFILPMFLGLIGVWISYSLSETIIMTVGLVFYLNNRYIRKNASLECQ
jgi:putative MATE family efflux protein